MRDVSLFLDHGKWTREGDGVWCAECEKYLGIAHDTDGAQGLSAAHLALLVEAASREKAERETRARVVADLKAEMNHDAVRNATLAVAVRIAGGEQALKDL